MRRIATAIIAALLVVLVFSAVIVGAALRMPTLDGASWARTFLLFAGLLVVVSIIAGLLPWRELRRAALDRDALAQALASRRAPVEGGTFPELARRTAAILQENRELAARAAQVAAGTDREDRLAAIGRLAAGLAHELRNPLTTVIGMAALARETCTDDRLARDLAAIEAEARRCEAISESILSFSRTPRLNLSPTRLRTLFDRPPQGLRVDYQEDPEAAVIVSDEILLGRVIANLLANAKEAGAGKVTVRIARCGTTVKITVADDGRGIPAVLLEQLFDAFTTTKTGGLGLGLAISRGILAAHGGDVTVRNRLEGGAEFTLTLPVSGPAGSPSDAAPLPPLVASPGKVV